MKNASATKKGPGRRPIQKHDIGKHIKGLWVSNRRIGSWQPLAKIKKLILKGKE